MAKRSKVSKKKTVGKTTGGKKIKRSGKTGKSVKKGKKTSGKAKRASLKKTSRKTSAKKSAKKTSTGGKTKKTSRKISTKKSARKVSAKGRAKKSSVKKTSSKKTSAKKSAKKTSTRGKAKKTSRKISAKKSARKVSAKGRVKKSSVKKTSDKRISAVDKAKKLIGKKDNYLKKVSGKKTSRKEKGIDQTGGKEAPETRITIQRDIVLTDAEGRVLCRVRDCDQPANVEAYCRYHYLLYWKKIQIRKKILSEGKLEKYVEELTSRYPNKYLELIKKDLSTEMGFLHAIQELDIDESSGDEDQDYDEERSFIEEVRGVSENSEHDKSDY